MSKARSKHRTEKWIPVFGSIRCANKKLERRTDSIGTFGALVSWGTLCITIAVPVIAAGFSPLLAWRGPAYIIAGFAGIFALAVMLIQPLLAGNVMPGLTARKSRQVHQWMGALLVVALLVHVGGLWITSPPDVIDVLLFRSPTPFSHWGAIAMWAVFAAALLAVLRSRLKWHPKNWRLGHTLLVTIAVICTVVHAVLIEGTMETITKVILCALVLLATARVVIDLRVWSRKSR